MFFKNYVFKTVLEKLIFERTPRVRFFIKWFYLKWLIDLKDELNLQKEVCKNRVFGKTQSFENLHKLQFHYYIKLM